MSGQNPYYYPYDGFYQYNNALNFFPPVVAGTHDARALSPAPVMAGTNDARSLSPAPSSSSEAPSEGSSIQESNTGTKRTYDKWSDEEQRLLVVLWTENFDRVESKESGVAWSEIAEKLNARFTGKSPLRTSESAKKKMKYLIDRYKKDKDWNKSQSGSNAKYPPLYKEIDEVLCNRDIVTLQHVAEAGCSASGESEGASTSDSQSSDNAANNQGRARRAERKKTRKRAAEEELEDEERKLLKAAVAGMESQRQDMGAFVQTFTRTQTEQLNTMNNLVGALTKFLEKQ